MNSICIVMPYFGKFRPSIPLWLESCRRNPEIDWLVFTDIPPISDDLPSNVIWHMTTLAEVERLASEKLHRPVCLKRPYKLCDLKVFYGVVFQDYLSQYTYWGYGDTDVIYGQVMEYLQRIDYQKYDKINRMGHLCLIRNTDVCNTAFDQNTPDSVSADAVLSNEANCGFDELDYNKKIVAAGLQLYDKIWAADIDIFFKRMRVVDQTTFRCMMGLFDVAEAPRNYRYQLFTSDHGRIIRYYLQGRHVKKDEFAYIHFREEAPIHLERNDVDCFLITRGGFEPFPTNSAQLTDAAAFRKLVMAKNPPESRLKEFLRVVRGLMLRYHIKPSWLP